MEIWTNFVDLIYTMLLGLSTIFGGNMGLAIGVMSLSVRLALLPLTLRFARRSMEVRAALKKLEPAFSNIRKKYKNDPQRMWHETANLQNLHGIRLFDSRSFFGMLFQAPLFIGVFAAVRRGLTGRGGFLWIKDLMQSDPLLALICAFLSGLSVALAPNIPESQRTATMIIPATLTFLFLWRVSAGVAVYSFGSSVVGVAQSLLLRRTTDRNRGLRE